MQKEQKRSQPSITVSQARPGVWPRKRRVALRQVEALEGAALAGLGAALARRAAASDQLRARGAGCACRTRSRGAAKRRSSASPSCCATQPPTPSTRPGGRAPPGAQRAEVARQPVLGLLADRAGVDEQQIRVVERVRRPPARVMEQVLDLLRVVQVHLAAVGADVVAARHGAEPTRVGRRVQPRRARPDSILAREIEVPEPPVPSSDLPMLHRYRSQKVFDKRGGAEHTARIPPVFMEWRWIRHFSPKCPTSHPPSSIHRPPP